MGTKANLLSGHGTIYIAPEAEALPELDDLAPPAVTIGTPGGNWEAEGYTEGDYSLECSPEVELCRVNEHNGPIEADIVDDMVVFKYQIKEQDMAAFSRALRSATLATTAAGADQTAQDTLAYGDGTQSAVSMLIVGTSPEAGSRVIHIYRAVQTSKPKFIRKKGRYPAIEVEFSLLIDPTQTAGGRFFKIYDITAVASS